MQPNIQSICAEYLHLNPGAAGSLSLLTEQLKREEPRQLSSRKNFVGHITASIFVLTPQRRVLLLEHKALNSLLQPGGHLEADDASPLAAALRELTEETGLQETQLTHRSLVPGKPFIPFDIDTHFIPENSLKQEMIHYHHDFRYLGLVTDEQAVRIDERESAGWRWVGWDEFKKIDHFRPLIAKIERLLEPNAEHFLQAA